MCIVIRHPVFNHVAPYRYMFPNVYLFVVDIMNLDLCVCCQTWMCLDITRFYEEQCQPFSGCTWPACPQNFLNRGESFDAICTAISPLA